MRTLFLASESPRRRELLEKAGVSFQTFSQKISEYPCETLTVNEQILDIARRKAMAAAEGLKAKGQSSFYVLAADTEVIVDQKLSGKPQSHENAVSMLKNLSARTHEVKTGIILFSYPENKMLSHLETTFVTFRSLSEDEVKKYVATGEPMDKAGAYGIQGEAKKFVQEFKGSYENVVGLPTEIVIKMISEMKTIIENPLQLVDAEIQSECQNLKRNPNDVKIIAVSKLQPTEKIKSLYKQGHKRFAENYVQEALSKQIELKDLNIEWHLIGHIQRKKINSILGKFHLIHSIDSMELLSELAKKCAQKNISQSILLEVNISQEQSKSGWSVEDLKSKWEEIDNLPGIQIKGLMTMPPATENPEEVRPYFRALKKLLTELKSKTSKHPMTELSMGTTQDYLIAIQEGATMIRIGTRLFGERHLQ